MKKILSCLLLISFFTFPIFAQDKDKDDEEKGNEFSKPFSAKVGGAGGFTPVVGMFDNTEIDKYLKAANLPTLGSDPMYLMGGEGYGYIMFLKNVRFGGLGVSGHRTVSNVTNNIKKEVEYGVNYGGFLVDYVIPVSYKLDVAFGASIGGGSIDIRMTKDDGGFKTWDSLWTNYGTPNSTTSNYTRKLTGSFGVFNPHVNVEYTVLRWMQIRLGVGYPIIYSPDWKLDDQFTVENVPSKIKASGYTVNAGIMFGFFGW